MQSRRFERHAVPYPCHLLGQLCFLCWLCAPGYRCPFLGARARQSSAEHGEGMGERHLVATGARAPASGAAVVPPPPHRGQSSMQRGRRPATRVRAACRWHPARAAAAATGHALPAPLHSTAQRGCIRLAEPVGVPTGSTHNACAAHRVLRMHAMATGHIVCNCKTHKLVRDPWDASVARASTQPKSHPCLGIVSCPAFEPGACNSARRTSTNRCVTSRLRCSTVRHVRRLSVLAAWREGRRWSHLRQPGGQGGL